MIWFRRNKEAKSVCRHKWFLSDFGVRESSDGIDDMFHDVYTITCENCQTIRNMTKYEYLSFIKVFPVEAPGGDAE